jgi:ParB family transcriptional regulator, chromosome partitioning protein
VSSRRGLPDSRKMRHDKHFVDELTNHAVTGLGQMIPVDQIETNREQPRSAIGDLTDLAASIRRHGILEPLLVRRHPDSSKYQLIAGERRFHAAIEAGLVELPCIEMQVSDREALELALIENLQRKDLTPFEEAEGYRALVDKYDYAHEDVAAAVGKARSSVTEALRLLDIPPAIRDLCRHADITARSLLLLVARAASIAEMEMLVQEIAEKSLDREAARYLSRQSRATNEEGGEAPGEALGSTPDAAAGSAYRPRRIRFRAAADAPIHLSLSVRRPDVSREDVIRSVEALLEQLRGGEFDSELLGPSAGKS